MGKLISVLVVDDHDMILTGFRSVLSREHDIYILDELSDGDGLVATIKELEPDVVLLDLVMEHFNIFEFLDELDTLHIVSRIVIVSSHLEPFIVVNGKELGLGGYLSKEDGLSDLLPNYIRKTVKGVFVASDKAKEYRYNANIKRHKWKLSEAQYEVLCLLAEGNDAQDIAMITGKDRDAVYSIIRRARDKFGAQNNYELLKMMSDNDILPR